MSRRMTSFMEGLCGQPFGIWNGHFFGRCFEQLAILWVTHILLAILSSFYIGYGGMPAWRLSHHLRSINIRIVITTVLSICPFVNIIGSNIISGSEFFMVDYLTNLTMSFCWMIHVGYLSSLRNGISKGIRGPRKVLASFALCFFSSVLNVIGIAMQNSLEKPDSYLKICNASLIVIAEIAYCLTLIPKRQEGFYDHSMSHDNMNAADAGSLPFGDEIRFPVSDALGVAESGFILSKLLFCWINPLVDKGKKNLLQGTGDLFDLPSGLSAFSIFEKIAPLLSLTSFLKKPNRPPEDIGHDDEQPHYSCDIYSDDEEGQQSSLLSCLLKCYGLEYFSIGVLKLLSDGLAFCGPVLLNSIVSYLEGNDASKEEYSYFYALALCIAAVLGAVISTQYNFQVSRTSLKIKGAIITALYGKTLALNKVKLGAYSTGQIMNFMSTDSDRIVNFCRSFHQFWSLPIQVIVTLYLLHQQVGFSFVVGMAFAVVVIALNQFITKKIGECSKVMMEAKDKRIKITSEIIHGIRAIKMLAWEDKFMEKVEVHRKKEVLFLKKRKYLDALCVYFWATTPVIMAFLTLATFVLLGNTLSASKAFTSIALFNMLITPLNAFPWVLNGLVEAWISLKRIQGFFKLSNFDIESYYSQLSGNCVVVQINGGMFDYSLPANWTGTCENEGYTPDSHSDVTAFHLGPLDLKILKGQLVCIIGKVGSGKSTLLYSVLGDLTCKQGAVGLCNSEKVHGVGFVSQEPWLQQTTIRDNILFGKDFDANRYREVLEACDLLDDLKSFPHNDHTEVGENGFTLSGGQRARIGLARAVYQDLDCYLIDDPFSSVDDDVAKHIFNHCIMGTLKNKTCIICTHRQLFASIADYVIDLEGGKILSQGSPERVLKVSEELIQHSHEQGIANLEDSLSPETMEPVLIHDVGLGQLVQQEDMDCGVVKLKVYKSYWSAARPGLAVLVLVCCFLMQSSRTLSDWWLSFWISKSNSTVPDLNASRIYPVNHSPEEQGSTTFYLCIYGGLVLFNSVSSFARAFSFAYAGILAAITLHNQLLQAVMKTSIDFFDVTPMGRILNRFSSDVYNADDTLPFTFNILLAQLFSLFGCLVITCYGLPWVTLLFIPLLLIYNKIQKFYRCTSRELKRLSSVTLSPLYAHFSETLNGHSTIRALQETYRFHRENMTKLDENNKASFATAAAAEWLNLRLQFIGVVVVTGIAFIALIQNEYSHVDPGLVGLALSYALSLTLFLNGAVTAFTDTEKELISVERILHYVEDLKAESSDGVKLPGFWPDRGAIEFKDVYVQYRPDLKPAVENITFKIRPGEKVGIIGRTGSGKTTLFKALLQLVNIKSGKIIIDHQDVARVNLKQLRSNLSVIPQDPFLFDGTVRENLDPSNCIGNYEMFRALLMCEIFHKVVQLGGLDSHVGERGQNLSAGERQLICLARAYLRKSKVVCMDEATSSIDIHTDNRIQETVMRAFVNTTILIIAHRLKTVLSCDRIVVMSNGRIVCIKTPRDLFEERDPLFYDLGFKDQ